MAILLWMIFTEYLVVTSYIRVKKLEVLTHDFMKEVAESLRKRNLEEQEQIKYDD